MLFFGGDYDAEQAYEVNVRESMHAAFTDEHGDSIAAEMGQVDTKYGSDWTEDSEGRYEYAPDKTPPDVKAGQGMPWTDGCRCSRYRQTAQVPATVRAGAE